MTPKQSTDPDAPPPPTAESSVGVLAALPRTRPQRTSARREAARAQARSETVAKAASPAKVGAPRTDGTSAKKEAPAKVGTSATTKKTTKKRPTTDSKTANSKRPTKPRHTRKAATTRPKAAAQAEPRAPSQGYEPEEEVELGNTVHPPSGGELIESIAVIFGELAGASAGAGGRLLKDVLSIFRRT
jgi:hypothetical protein